MYAVTAGDEIWGVGWARRIIPWGNRSAYLFGLQFSDPLGNGRLDVGVEWARLMEAHRANWYSHENPYVHRGGLIGHPMAYDESGTRSNEQVVYFRATYRLGDRWVLGGGYEAQRAGMRPQGRSDTDRVALDVRGYVRQGMDVRLEAAFFVERVTDDPTFGKEDRKGGLCALSVTYRR